MIKSVSYSKLLTQEQLKQRLTYNKNTGAFYWVTETGGVRKGQRAGAYDKAGYEYIGINNRNWKSHRLAWLYIYGVHPKNIIDHINGVKCDNRIINLREASKAENCRNSVSNKGLKGAYRLGSKWVAAITYNKKKTHLGMFLTQEEAHAAYCTKAKELYSEFFNAG